MRILIHQINSGNYNIAVSNLASSRLGDKGLTSRKQRHAKTSRRAWSGEKRGGGYLQARERATNVMRGLLTSAYQSLKIQIKNSTLNGQKKLLLVKQTLILWEVIYPVDSAIQPLNINRISKSFFYELVWPQGRIQDFFRRGRTRLLLYFNTNNPHSLFFFAEYQL